MLLGSTYDYYDSQDEWPQVTPTTSGESSSMMVANGGYQRGHARNELQLADFPSNDSGYVSKASQGVAQSKTISDAQNQLELATFPSSDSGYASKTSQGAVQGKNTIKGRDENTEDGDSGSVASLESRATDITMSSVNLAGTVGAAAEFAEVLLSDNEIRTLLEEGFQTMESDRFERNFRRLLKYYAFSLRSEAKDTLEKGATKIVHTYRTHVTSLISSRIRGSESEPQASAFHGLKGQEYSKFTLERYLGQVVQHHTPKHDETIEETGENSNSDAWSNFSDAEQPHLRNLEKVTDFLVSSAAFGAFKQALCSFVHPKSVLQACTTQVESSLSPCKDDSTPKDIGVPSSPNPEPLVSHASRKLIPNIRTRITNKIKKLLRPPVATGFERAEWICVSLSAGENDTFLTIDISRIVEMLFTSTSARNPPREWQH